MFLWLLIQFIILKGLIKITVQPVIYLLSEHLFYMKYATQGLLRPIQIFSIDLASNILKCNYSGLDQLKRSCNEHLQKYRQKYSSLSDSFIVLSSIGSIKTGKSTFLNQLLRVVNKFYVKEETNVFKTTETNQAHTKSIYACPILIQSQLGPINCILLDTPGFDSLQNTQQIDKLIFFVVKLISSTIIYNSYGSLDSSLIGRISGFCRGSQYQSCLSNPNLIFLQKDFALQLMDQDKNPITAKKYLKSFLENQDYNKNEIMQKNFQKIECCVLPIKQADKKSVRKYYQKISELLEVITISHVNSKQNISNFFQKIQVLANMLEQNSLINMKQFSKRLISVKKIKFQELMISFRQKLNIFANNVQKQLPLPQNLIQFKCQTFQKESIKIFKQCEASTQRQYKQKISNNLQKMFDKLKAKNNKSITQKINEDVKNYIASLNIQTSSSIKNEENSYALIKFNTKIVDQKIKQYGRHLIQNYPFVQEYHVSSAYGTIYREFYKLLYSEHEKLQSKNIKNSNKNQTQIQILKKETCEKDQQLQDMQRNLKIIQSFLQESKNECQKLKQEKLKDLEIISIKNTQILKLTSLLQIKSTQINQSLQTKSLQAKNQTSSLIKVPQSKTIQILQKTIKQKDIIIQNLKKEVDKTIESQKNQYKQIRAKLDFQGESIQIKSQFYTQRNKELEQINKKHLQKIKNLEKQFQSKSKEYQQLLIERNEYQQKFEKLQKETKKTLNQLNNANQEKNKTIQQYSCKIRQLQKENVKIIQNCQKKVKNQTSIMRIQYQQEIMLVKNKKDYFQENYLKIKEELKQKQENFQKVLLKIRTKQQNKSKEKSIKKDRSLSNSKEKLRNKETPSKKSIIANSIQTISNLSMSKKRKSTQSKFDERLEELQLQRSQIQKKKKICDKKDEVISKIQKCLQNELKSKKWKTSQKSNIFNRCRGIQNFDQESSILTTSKKYTQYSEIHDERDILKQTSMNYIQTQETLPDRLKISLHNMPCRRLF